MAITREILGFKFIADLPPSPSPWRMLQVGGVLYVFNPDHQPRRVRDDGLEVVTLDKVKWGRCDGE